MRTGAIIPATILTTVLLVLALPVGAITRTWQAETELWSNPDNWFPNGVPQNGDFLTFGDVSPVGETSMNNDLPNLIVNNMTFNAGGYSLRGQPLTFIQGITDNHSGSGINRINCNIQFVNGGGVFASLNTGRLEINGTTTLANNDNLNITATETNITVNGVIQGNGGLLKRGNGAVFLRGSGANTYIGPTRVEGGRLHLAKTSAARAISANVTINAAFIGNASLSDDLPGQYPPAISMLITNGGLWFITNGATVTNLVLGNGDLLGTGLLNLECDVVVRSFLCQIKCSLNLGNQTRTFSVNFQGQLDVFGNIIGPLGGNSGIIKQGGGLLILKNQNTYQGPTLVKDGDLYVEHGGALGSIGPGGETRLQGGNLRFEGGPLTCPEPIVVDSGASIEFSRTNTLTGPLTLNDTCVFEGRFDSDFLELRSTIDGPGGSPQPLQPVGLQVWGGTVRLSGTAPNTFGGGAYVSPFLVETAVLELAKPDNVMAVPGQILIRGGSDTFPGEAFLRQLQNDGVTNVSIGRNAAWLLNGHGVSPTALSFVGAGYVDTQGGALFLFNRGTNQLHALHEPFQVLPSDYTAWIFGDLVLAAETNTILVESRATLDIWARIVGPFPIEKQGDGTLQLTGGNSFTGPLTVNAGQLVVAHSAALGTNAAGTFVNNNASLAMRFGIEVTEPFTLNSTNPAALLSLGPVTNTLRGNILLQRTAGIHVSDPIGGLTHFGGVGQFDNSAISGPGGFTKSGPGAFFITGFQAGNSYTGPTTVADGLLEAMRRSSLSDSILVTGTNATLRTGRATGLSPARTVLPIGTSMTVEDGALWSMNGTNIETLDRLVGDGRLNISTGGALTISNSVSCTFDGQVSGSGALNKLGLATLHFTGQSPSYTGPATVFDGTYKVDGYFPASPVTVKLSSILRGSGAVGDVTVENGGVVRVDPGNPGLLGGGMQFNSANFHAGGVLAAQFFGPHPTAGNDFLYVLNGVTLSNSAHSFGFLYPPREGDVVTVIQKIAPDAISGAISGFPEGALRTIGQIPVVASYVGGNGNDVTLTVTNLPLRSGGAQLLSGNGGRALVPNDCSQLWLVVTNRGAIALTGLRGQLRSLTEGVLVTRAESAYPDLASNGRGSNATPFQVRTEPSFPCGGAAQFELILTASNLAPFAIVYTLLGPSGHALKFDGRDDQVEAAPNTFSSVVNSFTIELWANPTGSRTETAETNAGISGVSAPLRQVQRFAVFPDRGNLAYGERHAGAGLSIGRNGISAYEQGTNHLPSRLVYSNALSGWTHIALVYASRQPRLYVNGILVRSGSASLFPSVHPSASLGGSSQADYGNFQGQLDEVRIWNTALSQSQIQSNMMRSLVGNEAGLVTYFRCDEGSGTSLTDSASSSPNPTGTLTDGSAFVLPGVVPFSLPGGVSCDSGGGACESCIVVSGQFSTNANSLETIRRLTAAAGPSACDPPKPCPGFDQLPDAPVRHVVHHFTNSTAAELCLTAQLRLGCPNLPNGAFGLAANVGEFRINQPCSNYLGDDGAADSVPPPFSFRVPPQTNFLLVVTARTTNVLCDGYTVELFGLPCPPPRLDIAKDTNKVLLSWSTAYPDYRLQSLNSLDGSGPFSFVNVTNPPTHVSGKFVVTNETSTPTRYFRLAQ